MPDSPLAMLLLGFICLSAITVAVCLALIARDMRLTLQRVVAMLPQCEQTVREAHRLLTRTNQAARRIDLVMRKACETASETIEQILFVKSKAQTFFSERFGNGAGVEPRRSRGRNH